MNILEVMSNLTNHVDAIVPYIFFFFGFFACSIFLYSNLNIRFGKPYLKTEGKIIYSEINETFLDGCVSFSPSIKYEYEIDGKKCVGDYIYKHIKYKGSRDRYKAEQTVKNFHVGKGVDVYYKPLNFSKSYLIEFSKLPFTLFLVGIVFITIGIFKF